jgi:protein-S-isoprenylcysteine O-methyltransferase Ste14
MESTEKKGAAVKFPPPLLPIITIFVGYLIGQFVPLLTEYSLPTPARYWIGGLFTAIVVLDLGIWPIFQFKKTGQDVKPWTPTPEIVVSGPYKFTRNPMYLMMVLFCIGFAIILSNIWILILTPVCGILIYNIAIRHEEVYLESKFGDSYLEYKKRVRRWI